MRVTGYYWDIIELVL